MGRFILKYFSQECKLFSWKNIHRGHKLADRGQVPISLTHFVSLKKQFYKGNDGNDPNTWYHKCYKEGEI